MFRLIEVFLPNPELQTSFWESDWTSRVNRLKQWNDESYGKKVNEVWNTAWLNDSAHFTVLCKVYSSHEEQMDNNFPELQIFVRLEGMDKFLQNFQIVKYLLAVRSTPLNCAIAMILAVLDGHRWINLTIKIDSRGMM